MSCEVGGTFKFEEDISLYCPGLYLEWQDEPCADNEDALTNEPLREGEVVRLRSGRTLHCYNVSTLFELVSAVLNPHMLSARRAWIHDPDYEGGEPRLADRYTRSPQDPFTRMPFSLSMIQQIINHPAITDEMINTKVQQLLEGTEEDYEEETDIFVSGDLTSLNKVKAELHSYSVGLRRDKLYAAFRLEFDFYLFLWNIDREMENLVIENVRFKYQVYSMVEVLVLLILEAMEQYAAVATSNSQSIFLRMLTELKRYIRFASGGILHVIFNDLANSFQYPLLARLYTIFDVGDCLTLLLGFYLEGSEAYPFHTSDFEQMASCLIPYAVIAPVDSQWETCRQFIDRYDLTKYFTIDQTKAALAELEPIKQNPRNRNTSARFIHRERLDVLYSQPPEEEEDDEEEWPRQRKKPKGKRRRIENNNSNNANWTMNTGE